MITLCNEIILIGWRNQSMVNELSTEYWAAFWNNTKTALNHIHVRKYWTKCLIKMELVYNARQYDIIQYNMA